MNGENSEKARYIIYDGDIKGLAEKALDYCDDTYGDRCEFSTVLIERHHPDGGSWKVHEFSSLDDRAVRAVENHLKARRDVVKLKFGGSNRDYWLDFIICPARNTHQLARYIDKEERGELDEEGLVVLTVDRKEDGSMEEQKEFLEMLEDNK